MGRIALACVALALAPAVADAQSSVAPHYITEREVAAQRSIHGQAVTATALFVTSTALATLAWIMAPLGLFIGVASGRSDVGDEALLWGGVAAGALSVVLLIIGAVVDTSRHRLAHELRTSRDTSIGAFAIEF
jgi:hypothetical protein